jgi:hypothetical protein
MRYQKAVVLFDKRIQLVSILMGSWAIVWLGNGLDKYFNGEMRHDTDTNIAKYAVVNAETLEVEQLVMGYRIYGWFGANRDAKFKAYFSQLGLPNEVAQFFLYSISTVEIILGTVFLYLFIRGIWDLNHAYNKRSLYGSRTIHRLALKTSAMIWVCFVLFDILTGDRIEHWEHANFFLLLLMTYYLFIQSTRIEQEEHHQIVRAYSGEKNRRRSEGSEEYKGEDRRGRNLV